MTTRIQDAVAALKSALLTVTELDQRVYENPAASVTGVSVVLGPPAVEWGSFGGAAPTACTFVVHIVVPFDEYATARLYQLVEPIVTAIEADPLFAVASASPGLLQQGGTQLPTYALTVDVGL